MKQYRFPSGALMECVQEKVNELALDGYEYVGITRDNGFTVVVMSKEITKPAATLGEWLNQSVNIR